MKAILFWFKKMYRYARHVRYWRYRKLGGFLYDQWIIVEDPVEMNDGIKFMHVYEAMMKFMPRSRHWLEGIHSYDKKKICFFNRCSVSCTDAATREIKGQFLDSKTFVWLRDADKEILEEMAGHKILNMGVTHGLVDPLKIGFKSLTESADAYAIEIYYK